MNERTISTKTNEIPESSEIVLTIFHVQNVFQNECLLIKFIKRNQSRLSIEEVQRLTGKQENHFSP